MDLLQHLYPGDTFLLLALSVLLQATVVILAAWLASALFFRRHAAVRHGLWLAALVLVLLSPATALLMEAANVQLVAVSLPEFLTIEEESVKEAPAEVVRAPSNNVGALNSALFTREALAPDPFLLGKGEEANVPRDFASLDASPSADASLLPIVDLPLKNKSVEPPPPAPVKKISKLARLRAVAAAIFGIWILGVIYGLVRILRGGLALRRLLKMALPGEGDPRLHSILAEINRHLSLKRMPPVLLWRDAKLQITPLTVGIIRPVIVLSKKILKSLTPEELREVLLHECAHVLRRDSAVGLLQRIALTLFWPYPLLLLLNRQLTLAREEVCDNYVLLHTPGPQYAQTLFDLSERIHPLTSNLAPVALFQHHCPLEKRVAGLLDLRRNIMTKINRWAALCLAIVFLSITLLAAGARILKAEPKADQSPKETTATEKPEDTAKQENGKQESDHQETIVSGQVTDQNGKALAEVQVAVVGRMKMNMNQARSGYSLCERNDDKSLGLAKTDSDGQFRLSMPHWSSAKFAVVNAAYWKKGYGLEIQRLDMDADTLETKVQLLPEEKRSYRLVDVKGQPVAEVLVSVTAIAKNKNNEYVGLSFPQGAEAPPFWPKPMTTDKEGRLTLDGMAHDYGATLQLRDDRFARDELRCKPGEEGEDHTFTALSSQILEGDVVYADTRKPVTNARLAILCGGGSMMARADAIGHFRVHPSGNQFNIIAYPPEGEPYLVFRKMIEEGIPPEKIEIALPRGILVRGKIMEASSGKAVPAASVQFEARRRDYSYIDNTHPNDRVVSGLFAAVVGDEEGRFQIVVPPEKGFLFIQGPQNDFLSHEISEGEIEAGIPYGQRFHVSAILPLDFSPDSRPDMLNVTLQRGVTAKGRIVGPDGKPPEKVLMISRLFSGLIQPRHFGCLPVEIRNGQFELHGLDPEKTVAVYFLDPKNQLGARVDVSGKSAEKGPIVVRLEPCGKAVARFVDFDGKPLVNYQPSPRLVLTPGIPDGQSSRKGIAADEVTGAYLDYVNYRNRLTDEAGRCEFPALIPGTTYRVNVFHGNEWAGKEFTVKSGETVQLSDIEVERRPGETPRPSGEKATQQAKETESPPNKAEPAKKVEDVQPTEKAAAPPPPATELTYRCQVVDAETKQPIKDATVTVLRRSSSRTVPFENWKKLGETKHQTDAEGRYEFSIPPEQAADNSLYIEITATHPDSVRYYGGYSFAMIRKNETLGERPFYENLKLHPAAKISGTIVTPDGTPAEGVPIKTFSSARKERLESSSWSDLKTGKDGKFEARVHKNGEAILWIIPQDHAPSTHLLHATRGDLGRFTLEKGLVLKGRVMDADGKPLPNVWVNADIRSGAAKQKIDMPVYDYLARSALSDEKGEFAMAPLPAGGYDVMVTDKPRAGSSGGKAASPLPAVFLSQEITLDDNQAEKSLELRAIPHVVVKGQFLDSSGKPMKGFAPHLSARSEDLIGSKWWSTETQIDEQGKFTAITPKGLKATLGLHDNEHHALRTRIAKDAPLTNSRSVDLGVVDKDIDVEVIRYVAPTLLVKAVDQNGQAIKGFEAKIMYPPDRAKHEGEYIREGKPVGHVSFERQDDGRWRSSQLLPDEEFTLSVEASGYQSNSQTLSLAEGAIKELTVELQNANSKTEPPTKKDQAPASALERRQVNKLVKDFPEKTDLSTPEAAVATLMHSGAKKNIQDIDKLSWINWPKYLGVELKEVEDALRNDPHAPKDLNKLLESQIIEVLAYREDLAEVICKSDMSFTGPDGPYFAYFVGKHNGMWKLLTIIENAAPNVEDFKNYFEKNKETQWNRFQKVKKDVGDDANGKSLMALSVLPPPEKKTAPVEKKDKAAKPAASVERRAVNTLVKDFPEKIDLSTPESALAAYHRATAKIGQNPATVKEDAKAVVDLDWQPYTPRQIQEIERSWNNLPKDWPVYRQALLDAEVIEVDPYGEDFAVVISKLKFPEGAGRNPYSARSMGRINGQWKNLGEDRLPTLEAAWENFAKKKHNLVKHFQEVKDVVTGKKPKPTDEFVVPADKYQAVKATTPDAERLILMGLVENFFANNARDITARKTIEWGEAKKNDDGSRSIRYKFEARVWDKDTMIADQIFTFDKDNVMTSYKDAAGPPVKKEPKKVDVNTTEGMKALVEDFFAHNFRDVTARKTLEWGEVEKDTDGNSSIRYKYEATIWGKDLQIMNQIFTFDKKGEFVRYKNVEGYPQKVDKAADASRKAEPSSKDGAANQAFDLDTIAVEGSRQARAIKSIAYEYNAPNYDYRCYHDGRKYRVETLDNDEDHSKASPVIITAYNGQKYFEMGRSGLLITKKPTLSQKIPVVNNPIFVMYSWIAELRAEPSWESVGDVELWKKTLSRGKYLGELDVNGVPCHHVRLESSKAYVEAFFAKEHHCFPMRWVSQSREDGKVTSQAEVVQYKLMDTEAGKCLIPLEIRSIGSSVIDSTIKKDSLKINQPIDAALFTLSPTKETQSVIEADEIQINGDGIKIVGIPGWIKPESNKPQDDTSRVKTTPEEIDQRWHWVFDDAEDGKALSQGNWDLRIKYVDASLQVARQVMKISEEANRRVAGTVPKKEILRQELEVDLQSLRREYCFAVQQGDEKRISQIAVRYAESNVDYWQIMLDISTDANKRVPGTAPSQEIERMTLQRDLAKITLEAAKAQSQHDDKKVQELSKQRAELEAKLKAEMPSVPTDEKTKINSTEIDKRWLWLFVRPEMGGHTLADLDVRIKYAEAALEVAKADLQVSQEANSKVAGTVPKSKIRELELKLDLCTLMQKYCLAAKNGDEKTVSEIAVQYTKAKTDYLQSKIDIAKDSSLRAPGTKSPEEHMERLAMESKMAKLEHDAVEAFVRGDEKTGQELAGRAAEIKVKLRTEVGTSSSAVPPFRSGSFLPQRLQL